MEKETILKILGIIIVVALAGSMIAAGIIYLPRGATNNNDIDLTDLSNQSTTIFDYQATFDTNVLTELNSIRLAGETTYLNKQEIDMTIKGIDGVSRITVSEFRGGGEKWVYYAEIDLKKDSVLEDVVNEIFALEYFTGETQAMKKITINTPGTIEVYNADLNITRNFEFTYPTTVAIASLTTQVGDVITVDGLLKLKGNEITYIELIESANKTNQPETFLVNETLPIISIGEELFFEASNTTDTNVDENTLRDDLTLLDENVLVYFFQGQTFGQTNISNLSEVRNLLEANYDNVSLKRQAEFLLENAFITELNQEFVFENSFAGEVEATRNVGDNIPLEISINIQRGNASIVGGREI